MTADRSPSPQAPCLPVEQLVPCSCLPPLVMQGYARLQQTDSTSLFFPLPLPYIGGLPRTALALISAMRLPLPSAVPVLPLELPSAISSARRQCSPFRGAGTLHRAAPAVSSALRRDSRLRCAGALFCSFDSNEKKWTGEDSNL